MKRREYKDNTEIYCGHYPYVKNFFSKSYITNMRKLAEELSKGIVTNGEPYSIKEPIGPKNPMLVTKGEAGIVYDPQNIN